MSTLDKIKDYDTARLATLSEMVLSEACSLGATSAEVGLSVSSGFSVTVRLNDIETLEHYRDQSLAVTVYKGQAKGSASTSDLNDASVRDVVASACSIAGFTAKDDCAGLADPDLMAKDIPDLQLYHPWQVTVEEAIDLAKTCESAARDSDKRIINSEGASVTTYGGASIYANSHGFLGGYGGTRHSMSCSVIAGDEKQMQRDYWYSSARQHSTLQSADSIGLQAAERALQRLDARKLETCQAPVVFSPEMARSLLGSFIGAIRGGALYRQASFLLDYKGKAVFPDFITITEKPHLLSALGSAPFDTEGVSTHERDIVQRGVLQDYVLDSYSARKLGMQTTANAGGVRNLHITQGDQSQAELLQTMGKGLLVTEMMGQGVNNVTGDYSRGASGFWVENGEIQYPVEEITVAGNLKDMFMGIQAIANDVDTRSNIITGSILIDNMTIAGN